MRQGRFRGSNKTPVRRTGRNGIRTVTQPAAAFAMPSCLDGRFKAIVGVAVRTRESSIADRRTVVGAARRRGIDLRQAYSAGNATRYGMASCFAPIGRHSFAIASLPPGRTAHAQSFVEYLYAVRVGSIRATYVAIGGRHVCIRFTIIVRVAAADRIRASKTRPDRTAVPSSSNRSPRMVLWSMDSPKCCPHFRWYTNDHGWECCGANDTVLACVEVV